MLIHIIPVVHLSAMCRTAQASASWHGLDLQRCPLFAPISPTMRHIARLPECARSAHMRYLVAEAGRPYARPGGGIWAQALVCTDNQVRG